ncbi:hypothetical protein GCM10028827_37480 [Mucilaginibacter myungsuensis]
MAILAAIGIVACKKNENGIDLFTKMSENRAPVIIANTTFTNPTLLAAGTTTVSNGAKIAVEFNYVQTDPIKEIQFLQKIGTADSTLLSTIPYKPSFSRIKNCDTLLYDYFVPAGQPVGTSVAVRARVINQNGLFKDRVFTFKTKL